MSNNGHHCPRILKTTRFGCWAECRCGWLSDVYNSGAAASVAWANHVRERALRRQPVGVSPNV